jgi:hypothetical protein
MHRASQNSGWRVNLIYQPYARVPNGTDFDVIGKIRMRDK